MSNAENCARAPCLPTVQNLTNCHMESGSGLAGTWAAIARSQQVTDFGYTWGFSYGHTQAESEAEALQNCDPLKSGTCVLVASFPMQGR